MNEQLSTALAEVINKSISGIDKATDFVLAKLPDVIYQLLIWYGVKSLIMFLLGIILLTGVIICNIKHFKWVLVKHKGDTSWLRNQPWILMHIFQIFWFALLIELFNIEWLQIWIAPKVWLIEYAGSLVK